MKFVLCIRTRNGLYTASSLAAGTYRVEVSKEGFHTFVASDILLNQNTWSAWTPTSRSARRLRESR